MGLGNRNLPSAGPAQIAEDSAYRKFNGVGERLIVDVRDENLNSHLFTPWL